ncbi:MAG: dihydrodipicolinate synthase family protein [Clostridiales bacterium]|jgi:dihydrodipicolinate synthase/N-acetylneuraminate lyase|nr:dihydrodipicolinate synthase family protein [Clostridiales bacterium]
MNKREQYSHLTGVIAPVITPWTADERLDEAAFREQAKFIMAAGVHGISPAGSTGEGSVVRDDERNRMIDILREENVRNIPIVAGIIRHSTRDAIKAAREAKQHGADALMITPIQYLGGTDADGNYRFYEAISDAVDLPIIIYNVVPQNEIKPEVAFRLLDIQNVIGVKQSCGGVHGFMQMKTLCGEKGLMYAATDELMYTTYELGADGAIAAILGLFPALCVKLWDLKEAGDSREAIRLQAMIYPIWMNIIGAQFPRRLKAALECIGRGCGESLSPLNRATDAEYAQIRRAVEPYLQYEASLKN